jgi:hypothetical protein
VATSSRNSKVRVEILSGIYDMRILPIEVTWFWILGSLVVQATTMSVQRLAFSQDPVL